MKNQNWLIDNQSRCQSLSLPILDLPDKPYRLYRFLTEIEDIIDNEPDDVRKVQQIIPKVRKLLTSSYWLSLEFIPPKLEEGWSVNLLYDDYDFPLALFISNFLTSFYCYFCYYWNLLKVLINQLLPYHQTTRKTITIEI